MYLHKTSLVAENLLIRVLKRAKFLISQGFELPGTSPLKFFMEHKIDAFSFSYEVLKRFSYLDDYDIISSVKEWISVDDTVLSELSKMIINRDLLKIEMSNSPFSLNNQVKHIKETSVKFNISEEEAEYFVFADSVYNQAYNIQKQNVQILFKSGEVKDIANASDQANIHALSNKVTKYFICYPKMK